MSSISSLARSAVDLVQERIKTQSGKLTKHIEALLGVHRPPPASQSVVGDMNPTTAICQRLGLPLGDEHPGTTLRRSERLAADGATTGRLRKGLNPLNMVGIYIPASPLLRKFLTCPHDHAHIPRDGVRA